jgi:hypothetical protein
MIEHARSQPPSFLFRYPGVRRALGIPATPSETATPLRDSAAIVKRNVQEFWKDVKEKNAFRRTPADADEDKRKHT